MTPEDSRYAKSHEYVHPEAEGDVVVIGITDYAQKELGDVVFVELPQVGAELELGDEFGSIESVKAVSELFSPVSGEVVEVNEALTDEAGAGQHRSVRRRLDDEDAPQHPEEVDEMMTAEEYEEYIEKESAH